MSSRRGSPNLPDHPKELPTHMEVYRPSRGEVDPYPESPRGEWRCGLSTTQHWLTRPSHHKDSTNQPARECDVTMSFHGSSTKTSYSPPSTNLGPSRVHAPSYWLGIGDPIPLPTNPVTKSGARSRWFPFLGWPRVCGDTGQATARSIPFSCPCRIVSGR